MKKSFVLWVGACLLASAVQAQPPALPSSERFNQLLTELQQASAAGDTARVAAIQREIEAMTPRLQAEVNASQERARSDAAAQPMLQQMQQMQNQLQQQAQSPEWQLSLAARAGDLAKVQHWVTAGADLNVYRLDPGPPLMEAALKGHVAVAEYLIERGAQLRIQKGMITLDALRLAAEAQEDNSPMLTLLVKKGALALGDMENLGSAMMKDAEQKGQRHADMSGNQLVNGSALIGAIEKGRNVHVKTLLELGASANAWGMGQSALMIAAKKLNADAVALLLQHGADKSVVGPQKKTALQLAQATRENPRNAAARARVLSLLQP